MALNCLLRRNAIWRNPQSDIVYSSCTPFNISGYLIPSTSGSWTLDFASVLYRYLENITYSPECYDGKPVYSANKDIGIPMLPAVQTDWIAFINRRKQGEFMYSIYPTIYLITAATVVLCFLTVVVFTNTHKPSFFLMFGLLLTLINLINIFASSMKFLAKAVSRGSAPGEELLDMVQASVSFNVIDLFSIFLMQLCQVQVIMRIFSRQKEKRFAFVMGVSLSVISQVIWAVSTFHSLRTPTNASTYDADDDNLSIMPAFIYLLRIAMSVMYLVLICIYCFIKFEFIRKKHLVLISVVSVLSTTLQFAFFIADVANVWVAELSEVFNAAGYVISTVIVWEWIDRIHACERAKQSKGILGRPFYEEEADNNNRVDRVSLFVPEEEEKVLEEYGLISGSDRPSPEARDSPVSVSTNFISKQAERTHNFLFTIPEGIKKCTDTLAYITDQVIAYGLAVPRSVSAHSKNRSRKNFNIRGFREGASDESTIGAFTMDGSDSDHDRDSSSPLNEIDERRAAPGPTFIYNTAMVEIASESGGEELGFELIDNDIEENASVILEMSDEDSVHV